VSDKYGKSPSFAMIAADGPTSVSAEMTLPQSPEDIRRWQADSYTPHKYIDAWETALQFYAADFPNQFISLSVGSGLNINDQGKIEAREGTRTRQAIMKCNPYCGMERRYSLGSCTERVVACLGETQSMDSQKAAISGCGRSGVELVCGTNNVAKKNERGSITIELVQSSPSFGKPPFGRKRLATAALSAVRG
jgi:hypothetical protein